MDKKKLFKELNRYQKQLYALEKNRSDYREEQYTQLETFYKSKINEIKAYIKKFPYGKEELFQYEAERANEIAARKGVKLYDL